jgi:hypothetical protein
MITFWNATFNEFNDTNNGGDSTTIIESGVAESFIKRVRPYTAEFGGERWFKFFIKSDIDIVSIGVDIAKSTTSEKEEVYIGIGKDTNGNLANYESDIDKNNFKPYGGFIVTDIDIDNKTIVTDIDLSDFVASGDIITFYDSDLNRIIALKVDSIDSNDNTKIIVTKWGDKQVLAGYTGASSLFIESLDADTEYPIWLKQIVPSHTTTMEDPLDEFNFNVWYDIK